jgi:tetratricopeptide (TPR) repeat protein
MQKRALEDAIQIFSAIIMACKDNPSCNDILTDCMISAVAGSLVCANHTGNKDHQSAALDVYNKNISYISSIPYFAQLEKMLSIRNRAYNQQFNSYDFQSIIDDFEAVVNERVTKIPNNKKDCLTGELLGTIGQAYAFQCRNNAEYAERAEQYFNDSLRQFIPGHIYHQMSVNYLTTLKWCRNDFDAAVDAFAMHVAVDDDESVEQWISAIVEAKELREGAVFNLSVLLRLAVSQAAISSAVIDQIDVFLAEHNTGQHPYELIYKWIGVYYLNNDQYDEAIRAFDSAIKLSDSTGFTLQTIAISVIGLKCIAMAMKSEHTDSEIKRLRMITKTLRYMSIGFDKYIDSIGGVDQMLEDVAAQNISAVSRWLPFAYA